MAHYNIKALNASYQKHDMNTWVIDEGNLVPPNRYKKGEFYSHIMSGCKECEKHIKWLYDNKGPDPGLCPTGKEMLRAIFG